MITYITAKRYLLKIITDFVFKCVHAVPFTLMSVVRLELCLIQSDGEKR